MQGVNSVTISAGGTGYVAGDILTVIGGTSLWAAKMRVSAVLAGVVTGVTVQNTGRYSALPGNPVSFAGGSGVGVLLILTWVAMGGGAAAHVGRSAGLRTTGGAQAHRM